MRLTCFVFFLAACSSEKGDTADTADTCPDDVASFCATEFGGACPTFTEAVQMTCDDGHFVAPGTTEQYVSAVMEHAGCSMPTAECRSESELSKFTLLYFSPDDEDVLQAVLAHWDGEPCSYFQHGTVVGDC